MNSVDKINELDKNNLNALGENVKDYISLEDEDVGQFLIAAGKLYYIGNDEMKKIACESQGIITNQNEDSSDNFEKRIEEVAISSILSSDNNILVKKDNNGNVVRVGENLYSKNLENANRWKLVTEIVEGNISAIYGTGWTYVPAGEKIDGLGTLSNAYIVNFEKKKAVQYNDSIHSIMGVEESLGVADHLVFNADPGVMEEYNNAKKNNQEFDISRLGNGIVFVGYNDENGKLDLSKAFTKSTFEFDGIDDYIKIPYTSSTDLTKGFTWDFYGIMKKVGHSYKYEDGEYKEYNKSYKGIFCLWNGEENKQGVIRFGYQGYDKNDTETNKSEDYQYGRLFYNATMHGGGYGISSVWSKGVDSSGTNISPPKSTFSFEEPIQIAITFDVENQVQRLYINGEKIDECDFNNTNYLRSLNNYASSFKYFSFGRSSMENEGRWHYSSSSVYSLKFYNRALTEEEMRKNYLKSVSYHEFLENDGNAETQESGNEIEY